MQISLFLSLSVSSTLNIEQTALFNRINKSNLHYTRIVDERNQNAKNFPRERLAIAITRSIIIAVRAKWMKTTNPIRGMCWLIERGTRFHDRPWTPTVVQRQVFDSIDSVTIGTIFATDRSGWILLIKFLPRWYVAYFLLFLCLRFSSFFFPHSCIIFRRINLFVSGLCFIVLEKETN